MYTSTENIEEDQRKIPYSSLNKVITEEDVSCIFREFGLYGTKPQDLNLYRTAMVHKSYCIMKNQNVINGNRKRPDNCLPLQEESYERLEFLGDSILGSVVSMYLFERYPDKDNQGVLSNLRSKLVNGQMLAHLCSKTQIPEFIIISQQLHAKKTLSKNILEDVFEAFIGAMYVDTCSLDKCYIWLTTLMERFVDFSELASK
jgi:dsRNA-specific ribonuclease